MQLFHQKQIPFRLESIRLLRTFLLFISSRSILRCDKIKTFHNRIVKYLWYGRDWIVSNWQFSNCHSCCPCYICIYFVYLLCTIQHRTKLHQLWNQNIPNKTIPNFSVINFLASATAKLRVNRPPAGPEIYEIIASIPPLINICAH